MLDDVGGPLMIVGTDHIAFQAQFLDQRQHLRLGRNEAVRAALQNTAVVAPGFHHAS